MKVLIRQQLKKEKLQQGNREDANKAARKKKK
jgi:hypothetical protein